MKDFVLDIIFNISNIQRDKASRQTDLTSLLSKKYIHQRCNRYHMGE